MDLKYFLNSLSQSEKSELKSLLLNNSQEYGEPLSKPSTCDCDDRYIWRHEVEDYCLRGELPFQRKLRGISWQEYDLNEDISKRSGL